MIAADVSILIQYLVYKEFYDNDILHLNKSYLLNLVNAVLWVTPLTVVFYNLAHWIYVGKYWALSIKI
jgi:hypothetical protein